MNETGANAAEGLRAAKIWDYRDSWRADGGRTDGGVDDGPSGEIHPQLARYKGWWLCGFKENNRVRLIRSRDAKRWEPVRLFEWESGLVGCPRFSVTADGTLMITTIVKGLIHPDAPAQTQAKKPERLWTASVTWLSRDGVDWGHVHACPTGFASRWVVRFHTTWFRGAGYSVTSTDGDLFRTLDGKNWGLAARSIWANWRPVAPSPGAGGSRPAQAPRPPDETTLAFDPTDGTACALARNHPLYAILGTAKPPDYAEWTWRQAMLDWEGDGALVPAYETLGVQMGGPVLMHLSNGLLLAAGRYDASPPNKPNSKGPLALFLVDRDRGALRRWADFAEAGYGRQYPGVVEHEGKLWIVTGRWTKENPFEVHLLTLPLPNPRG